MTRLELFRTQAREFNNIDDPTVEAKFSIALIFIDSYNIDATKLDLAVAYFTAHLFWLDKYPAQGGASRGPITNEKDDKLQKQYALIQDSDSWLGQNFYGQSFSQLTGIFSIKRNRPAIITRFGLNPPFDV
jgi:hypothetical protein